VESVKEAKMMTGLIKTKIVKKAKMPKALERVEIQDVEMA
jgi:hypothetical protein